MTARAALVLSLAAASAACGAPRMKLPSGPGAPAADAPQAIDQATAACRGISTLTAEIGVSGSVNGMRMRGRLLAGLAAPASARLEAVAPFGPPVFIFVATGDDATLLLPRDRRVLEHGRPAAVLEAITGVPLDAAALRRVITGCAGALETGRARQVGDDWRIVPGGGGDVYLHRERPSAPWRLVAADHQADGSGAAWRAEYRDFSDGLPRGIRLASGDNHRFDLDLRLSQVEVGMPLGPDAFRVQIPASTQPISLAELRDSGPLRANER